MDFVDFNLAKKLKEKGFDIPCIYAYCEKGGWNMYTQKHEPIIYILRTDGNPFGTYYIGKNWNKKYNPNKNKIQCSAPTISQVLKWLREKHNLYVCPQFLTFGEKEIYHLWDFSIINLKNNGLLSSEGELHLCDSYKNYEQATLAGIEYVLYNLI